MTGGGGGGVLVIVATPIGNLDDVSPRAVRTLAGADMVVCEDTRRTRKLFSARGVAAPALLSANDHSEASRIGTVLDRLCRGETVAVVSDAGVPGISDPGERLVRAAVGEGFEVTVVPGPSAAISGLVVSGLPTGRFLFEGFLPRRGAGREERLAALAGVECTIVCYESPHRLARTLADLAGALGGDRPVALCRELTKLHEETWRGTLDAAVRHVADVTPRGEYVVVLGGSPPPATVDDDQLASAVDALVAEGSSTRDAVAEVASAYDVSKRRVYDLVTRR
ncbi:MAG TPA: 16S rRNA (cytidine(1402)-2'-O)-methyltransferase [Acidimicrobiales bacterium]|nr:16S rRNA (cytidine(1402)-2'-O)-methyltransferase [Acidimicrobiales bacterium]